MAKKKNEQYSDDDQDYEDEPNFSDPEGFVDDVTDEGNIRMPLPARHGWNVT